MSVMLSLSGFVHDIAEKNKKRVGRVKPIHFFNKNTFYNAVQTNINVYVYYKS